MAELALDLDHDAIALLCRAEGGTWERLGEARLDAPDLDERLRALRGIAEREASGPVETALILPDSQILYLDLPLPDHAAGERGAVIARALDERMPDGGEGLAFDWQGPGFAPRVAVVSKDTLREAEAFAAGYGFGPVRFTARPGPEAAFAGAPDFGPTRAARAAAPAAQAARPRRQRTRAAMATIPRAEAPRIGRTALDGAPAATPRRGRRPLLIAGAAAVAIAIASATALTLWPDADTVEVAVAPVPEAPVVTAAPDASPLPEPRPFAAEPVVVPVPPAGAPTRAAPVPAEEAPETQAVEAPAPEPDPEQAEADRARAQYAATGIWQIPPEPGTAPEVYEAGLPEPLVDRPEASASATPELVSPIALSGDAPPPPMPLPPPPDATFDLAEDGRVRAEPEGAASPDGVTIYAAAPPRRPPSRPPETILPPGAVFQDPALADARPRPRPERGPAAVRTAGDDGGTDAATADARARSDDAEVGAPLEVPEDAFRAEAGEDGASPTDLAVAEAVAFGGQVAATGAVPGLVPLGTAPAITFVAPDAATDGAAAASLFRSADGLSMAAPAPVQRTTAEGFVVAAPRPAARPEDIAAFAAAARAPAAAAAAVVPAPAAAPALRTVAPAAPALPSRASVARRATVENALALNRLSLVGVFGAEGGRRALVRLPSGRFEKVKVGDRIDGGRVQAIADGRLTYVRGGRSVTLEMPGG